jgi:hypothetical protein
MDRDPYIDSLIVKRRKEPGRGILFRLAVWVFVVVPLCVLIAIGVRGAIKSAAAESRKPPSVLGW